MFDKNEVISRSMKNRLRTRSDWSDDRVELMLRLFLPDTRNLYGSMEETDFRNFLIGL